MIAFQQIESTKVGEMAKNLNLKLAKKLESLRKTWTIWFKFSASFVASTNDRVGW